MFTRFLTKHVSTLTAHRHPSVLRGLSLLPSRGMCVDTTKKRDDHPYVTGAARYMPGFSFPAPRDLSSIVKYALLEREPPHIIKDIWLDYHNPRRDCVADVLEVGEFEGFMERSRKNPMFIFPVRRGENEFFVLLSQFQGRHCIFTYLEDYKKNPSGCEPYFAVTFFDDFVKRKGLVLARGDFSGHLTKLDAQRLLNLLTHYYLKEPKLVETFNQNPSKFDINAYLRDCP